MKKEYALGGIGILLVGMVLGSAVSKMSHKGCGAHRGARMERMEGMRRMGPQRAQRGTQAFDWKSAKSKKNKKKSTE